MTKPEAWAIFNPATGRWTKACPDCAQDLHPIWLPALARHGAWLDKTPVILVPQHTDDGLHQGDSCDLCPRHGRRAVWTGTEWDMRSEVVAHRGSHEGLGGSAGVAPRRRVTTTAPSPLPAVGSVNGASSPTEVPVLPAPQPGLELERA